MGKQVIFIFGPAGSGKMSLGKALAKRLAGHCRDTSEVILREYTAATGCTIPPAEKETYRHDLVTLGNLMTSRCKCRLVQEILSIQCSNRAPLVICGVRRRAELEESIELCEANGYLVSTFYVVRPGVEPPVDNFELLPVDAGFVVYNSRSLRELESTEVDYCVEVAGLRPLGMEDCGAEVAGG